jgi:hypothetical protein
MDASGRFRSQSTTICEAIVQSTPALTEDIAMSASHPLLAPMDGTEHQKIAGVQIDITHAGAARIKRVIYPAGFHWSTHIKPVVGTDFCMHAHVGFLAHGQIHIEFPDGCRMEFAAPQAVVIEPGHDGWVVGNEPAVLIEFDFEGNTARMCGVPEQHAHGDSAAKSSKI